MNLTDKIKEKIKNHCLTNINNESCGIILNNGDVIPCKNQANDSDVHFIISSQEIKKIQKKDKIAAVYHSHVKSKDDEGDDKLSEDDIVIAEYFNICFVLYSLTKDDFFVYEPTGKPVNYVGRPYVRHVLDEFVLIKDYYQRELNIEISINSKNFDTFLKNNGFVEVQNTKSHDIIMLKWQNKETRLSICLDNNKILIQPEFDSSQIVKYTYGLKRWTQKIYRHEKLT